MLGFSVVTETLLPLLVMSWVGNPGDLLEVSCRRQPAAVGSLPAVMVLMQRQRVLSLLHPPLLLCFFPAGEELQRGSSCHGEDRADVHPAETAGVRKEEGEDGWRWGLGPSTLICVLIYLG